MVISWMPYPAKSPGPAQLKIRWCANPNRAFGNGSVVEQRCAKNCQRLFNPLPHLVLAQEGAKRLECAGFSRAVVRAGDWG
jgi:hypothetical protein